MEYGPQTAEIQSLLEKVSALTSDQAERLGLAWKAAQNAARETGWNIAWSMAYDAAWNVHRSDVRVAGRHAIYDSYWNAPWGSASVFARSAARDAMIALLVKDEISPEHFATLCDPWESVMG